MKMESDGERRGRRRGEREKRRGGRGEVELWNLSATVARTGNLVFCALLPPLLSPPLPTTTHTSINTLVVAVLILLLVIFVYGFYVSSVSSFPFNFLSSTPWPIMADSEFSPKFAPFFSFVGVLDRPGYSNMLGK